MNIASFRFDENDAKAVASMRSLEELSFDNDVFDDLEKEHLVSVSDNGVWFLANGLAQLKDLSFTECKNITIEGVKAIVNGASTSHLTELRLDCRLGVDECMAIANGTSMTRLERIWGTVITADGFSAIAGGISMKSLKVIRANIRGLGFSVSRALLIAEEMPSLVSLIIDRTTHDIIRPMVN